MPHTLLYLGMRFLSRLHSALHSAWSHTPHTDLRPAHHTRTRTRATPESSPHSSVFPCVVPYFSSSASSTVVPRSSCISSNKPTPPLHSLSALLSVPTATAFRISYPSHSHLRSRLPHLLPFSLPSTFPRHSHASSPPPHSSNCIPKPLLPRPTPLPHPIPSSPPSNNSESFTLT